MVVILYKIVNTLQNVLLHLLRMILFMQYTYNQIIEQSEFVQRFITPNDKELLTRLFGDASIETICSYTHHIVVYINSDEQPIPLILLSGAATISTFNKDMTLLKTCILNTPKLDFNKLLFIVSVFAVRPNLKSVLFNENQFRFIIDTWLSDTNGYIFYSHQLEQLYCMLTGANYMEAISFRKDWNLKRTSTIRRAQNIMLNNALTLADALQQKTVDANQFVFNANYSGAYKLWHYIIEQSKRQ